MEITAQAPLGGPSALLDLEQSAIVSVGVRTRTVPPASVERTQSPQAVSRIWEFSRVELETSDPLDLSVGALETRRHVTKRKTAPNRGVFGHVGDTSLEPGLSGWPPVTSLTGLRVKD